VIEAQTSLALQVQCRQIISGRLWQVWVQTNSAIKRPVYINKARPYHARLFGRAPNGLIRVFGRNMTAPGTVSETPWFACDCTRPAGRPPPALTALSISHANGSIAATRYSLTFRVPSNRGARSVYSVWFGTARADLPEKLRLTQRVALAAHTTT